MTRYRKVQIPKPHPPIEGFSQAEVAATFRVSERTVYRWVKAGKLKAVRDGGRVLIERDELERYAAQLAA
jgi:excisionase family DNA binding protein